MAAVATMVAGCGRLGYEPGLLALADGGSQGDSSSVFMDAPISDAGGVTDGTTGSSLPICFQDNFDDGTFTEWTTQNGSWAIGPGLSGQGLRATSSTWSEILRSDAMFSGEFVASVDVKLDAAATLFELYFFDASFQTLNVLLQRPGTMNDQVLFFGNGAVVDSAQAVLTTGTWHHVVTSRSASGEFVVQVDGTEHFRFTVAAIDAPFKNSWFGIYSGGVIDNVVIRCR